MHGLAPIGRLEVATYITKVIDEVRSGSCKEIGVRLGRGLTSAFDEEMRQPRFDDSEMR